jgi:hypothetical protein
MVRRTKRNDNYAVRALEQLSKPNPRMNLRGRLNENVTFVSGNEYDDPPRVGAGNTVGHGDILFAPGNTNGRANAAINRVGEFFQKGLYLPGTFVKYIPSVGLNTNGNIIMGYIDSPDLIRIWLALPAGNQLNFIRDLANAKTGPVWQELTYPITQAPRRKNYMVDSNISGNIDAYDLSVQGMVIWVLYGVDAPVAEKTFGQLQVHCKVKFEEVKSFINTA